MSRSTARKRTTSNNNFYQKYIDGRLLISGAPVSFLAAFTPEGNCLNGYAYCGIAGNIAPAPGRLTGSPFTVTCPRRSEALRR